LTMTPFQIDCSNVVDISREIIRDNGYSHIIEVMHAKLEDINELPGGETEVDVIVSEWMGYSLLYESMLNSVIFARNKWLKTDGVMMPDRASLYLCAIEDHVYKEQKFDW
jgi:type I protein arginine methyltransferase